MVPEGVRQRWEEAYREYGRAWAQADQSTRDCNGAPARAMAAASKELAVAWRELGSVAGLPWWVVAAVMTAAEALESQAYDWTGRAERAPRPKPRPDVPTVPADAMAAAHNAPTEPIPATADIVTVITAPSP